LITLILPVYTEYNNTYIIYSEIIAIGQIPRKSKIQEFRSIRSGFTLSAYLPVTEREGALLRDRGSCARRRRNLDKRTSEKAYAICCLFIYLFEQFVLVYGFRYGFQLHFNGPNTAHIGHKIRMRCARVCDEWRW